MSPALLFNRIYPNLDLEAHYRLMVEFGGALREGVWQPRWASLARGGFGEPMPVYYPPLIYYFGGLLMLGGVSAWTALKLVVVTGLTGAAIAMRRLCAPWMPAPQAALAAFSLLLCPLVLLLDFSTANVPWMAGVGWGVLLLARCLEWKPGRHEWLDPWFAVLLTLLTMTHILSALMVLATVPVVALGGLGWVRAWRRLAFSSLTGLLLAGFYLWPAVTTMHMINPNRWTGAEAYRESFNLPLLYKLSGGVVSWPTVQIYLPLLFTLALAPLGVWMWRRRGEAATDPAWRPMAALLAAGLLALLLTTELSLPVWKVFRPLHYLQFPWRFLYIVLMAFCAVLAYATGRGVRWAVWLLGLSMLLGVGYFAKMYGSGARVEYGASSLTGVYGLPEYKTAVSGNADGYRARGGLAADCAAAGAECVELDRRSLYRRWRITASQAVTLRLPVYAYPGWGVRRNGAEQTVVADGETGLVPVRLEAGPQEVELFWRGLEAERTGRWLSVAGLVMLAAGIAAAGRRRKIS